MWRCRLALVNCVMTKMRSMPPCRLLLIGMSIRRNLPPTGTAGFARSRVRGHNRLPCPPPRMAVTTFSTTPPSKGRGYLTVPKASGSRSHVVALAENFQVMADVPGQDVGQGADRHRVVVRVAPPSPGLGVEPAKQREVHPPQLRQVSGQRLQALAVEI